jgi:heparan-sulfate lyase
VIVDEAIGNATGDIDIHFQLAPGAGAAIFNRVNLSVSSDFKEGWNVFVKTNQQKGIELLEEEGQVSSLYTKKEPRPAFCYRVKKNQNQDIIQFISLVVPYEKEVPEIQVKDFSVQSGKINLEITENGIQKKIGYEL